MGPFKKGQEKEKKKGKKHSSISGQSATEKSIS